MNSAVAPFANQPKCKPSLREDAAISPDECCLLCRSTSVSMLKCISTREILRGYKVAYSTAVGRSVQALFEEHPKLTYWRCTDCDLHYFTPPITGSDEYYSALQQLSWYYLADKPEYHFASRFVPPGARVLEIGCGSGAFSQFIEYGCYSGLEFNSEAVRTARERGLHIESQTIEQYAPDHTEYYDVVCAFQVLEHVAAVHDFIECSVRALKPGGILIYCVPSQDSFFSLIPNSLMNMPPHHITRWSDAALMNIRQIFPLELVTFEREQLAQFHTRAYATLIIFRALNSFIRRVPDTTILDYSPMHRALMSIASRLGGILEGGIDHGSLIPRGHSVTAIFRKVTA